MSAADYIMQRITLDPGSGCWLWEGSVTNGYGHTGPAFYGSHRAHRISYRAFVGPIPLGHDVCHKCDVRLCLNPDHLFTGTHKENMQDCISKGRFVYPRVRRGPEHHAVKLSPEQVREIRAADTPPKELAIQYGVSRRHVSDLLRGKYYQIPEPPKE